jgi:hypothetical protein
MSLLMLSQDTRIRKYILKYSDFIPKNVEFKPDRLVNTMTEADKERSMVTSSGNTPYDTFKKGYIYQRKRQ